MASIDSNELLDGSRHFLDRGGLRLGAFAEVGAAFGDRPGAFVLLVGGLDHLPDHVAQVRQHLAQSGRKPSHIVGAGHVAFLRQVALGRGGHDAHQRIHLPLKHFLIRKLLFLQALARAPSNVPLR